MKTLFLGHNLLKFPSLSSTNDFCWELLKEQSIPDGTLVWTATQTQGKGQRGKSWQSEKGNSLTFSILLRPNVKISKQFFLNKAIALGVCEGINSLGLKAKIKWPNDIYIKDKKLAGILIENSLRGSLLQYVVVGVGVNINQDKFSKDLPNPVSLKQVLHQSFDLKFVLEELSYFIEKRYMQFKSSQLEKIDTDYHAFLYRFQQMQKFQLDDKRFEAQILGVDEMGKIKLLSKEKIVVYAMNEVKFLS